MSYTYKTTRPDLIGLAERFFDECTRLTKEANQFCDKYGMGKPGFTSFMLRQQFSAVLMSQSEWNEKYRDEWRKPTKSYSTPKVPKKGKQSAVYDEFHAIEKVDGHELCKAIGCSNFLWSPGLKLQDGTLYIDANAQLDIDGFIEVTRSEYEKAAADKQAA